MKALFAAALLPLAALAGTGDQVDATPDYTALMHSDHAVNSDSELVKAVHDATSKYTDIKQVTRDNIAEMKKHPNPKDQDLWIVGTPCVSGPDHGAMGIHIVKLSRAGTPTVDIASPTALIYEPQIDGHMVLVGLEYIKDMAAWAKSNPGTVPNLNGHLMNFLDVPNRYGLNALYEIHVWAFEGNPKGAFADWNTHVTCEKQPLNFSFKP